LCQLNFPLLSQSEWKKGTLFLDEISNTLEKLKDKYGPETLASPAAQRALTTNTGQDSLTCSGARTSWGRSGSAYT
jgi:hypothetical protein